MSWLVRAERVLRPAIQMLQRLRRGMTLGVRGLVTDAEGRILLVEHTYVTGWYMPGGGIERGETAARALERELVEEAGVQVIGPMRLASVHNNDAIFPGDHILIYHIDRWTACPATSRGEIKQVGWFAPDALPAEVTRATRARIEEALSQRPPHPHW